MAVLSGKPPLPPSRPQPLASFRVEFAPATAQRYPPTDVKEVRRFKIILHLPGRPERIREAETPSRPYVNVGELRFAENWYSDTTVTDLIKTHVARVGGDAVLIYRIYQTAAATVKNPDTGSMEALVYGRIVCEVIRYSEQ